MSNQNRAAVIDKDVDVVGVVKVGAISEDNMAPIMSVALGCLVSLDMMIV